jgi:hypothetical protein
MKDAGMPKTIKTGTARKAHPGAWGESGST